MLDTDIKSGRKYIGKVLVEQGLIDQTQLETCLEYAKAAGKRIGSVLKERGLVDDAGIARALSKQLSIPYLDLTALTVTDDVLRVVPENLAETHLVLPIAITNGVLHLVMANPLDSYALEDVRFVTQLPVKIIVAPESQVLEALGRHYFNRDNFNPSLLSTSDVQSHLEIIPGKTRDDAEGNDLDELLDLSDKPPIIKFTNAVLIDAIRQEASDIHIEPRQKTVVIRYRIDGVIKSVMETERRIYSGVLNRIKVLSNLDISIRRQPQDGKFKVHYDGAPIDLRVSTLPTAYGEKITIRILNSQTGPESVEMLGFRPALLTKLKHAISKPQGLVLVTGPTGSGKSTTLHACIKSLHTPEVNIVTLENPIEYELEGINQVEVNPKQGLTFAGGLRSILRQDPDIILLGEIRDRETAEVAFHAGQTGHLVLSTLHTNSALATIDRLLDLGVNPASLATGINAIVSQRLVRKLCDSCKQLFKNNNSSHTATWEATGCERCEFTGYSGRIGIHEVFPMTPALRKLIIDGAPQAAIEQAAMQEGMEHLHDDGIKKAEMGLTSLSEVYRVAPPPNTAVSTGDAGEKPGDVLDLDDHYEDLQDGFDETHVPIEAARPHKILVACNQEFMQHFLRGVLEGEGHLVVTAAEGTDALRKTQMEIPDLLVAELKLTGLDALELISRIRSKLSTSYIPVVVISPGDDVGDEVRCLDAGADDFITMPINAAKLSSRVSRLLARSHRN